jgi:lantibiotic modifying enzyme
MDVDSMFLSKNLKSRLSNLLDDVIVCVHENETEVDRLGLYDGKVGLALFYYTLGEFEGDKKYQEKIESLIAEVYERINSEEETELDNSFCNGLAGIAWGIEYLIDVKCIDREYSLYHQINDYLLECMKIQLMNGNLDLMSGAVGTAMNLMWEKDTSYHKLFLSLLKDQMQTGKEGGYLLYQGDDHSVPLVNFGIAHGMSGVLLLLADFMERSICKSDCRELIEELCRFHNHILNKVSGDSSYFPYYLNGEKRQGACRLAWCWGDLGIGYSLLKVARVLKDTNLEKNAFRLLRNSTGRIKPEDTLVIDGGVCHGAFGNSFLFQQVYCATGDDFYKNAVNFWLEEGLEMRRHEDGFCGFKFHYGEMGWLNRMDLINGLIGVGLVLMSMLSKSSLGWSKCILINRIEN